jgi:hypothetical protein
MCIATQSMGYAPLLQSLLCPMLYSPQQFPIYENSLLKLLAQAQNDAKIREKGILVCHSLFWLLQILITITIVS